MRARLLVLLMALALCAPGCGQRKGAPAGGGADTSAATPASGEFADAAGRWVAQGLVAEESEGGAATSLGTLTRTEHPEGEAFYLRTGDGASFTPRGARVEVLRDLGVVRLRFPAGVGRTAFTDTVFADGLVASAYAVRSLDHSLYVDLHIRRPVAVRADFTEAPGAVLVWLRPGGPPLGASAANSQRVVLFPPRPRADGLLVAEGYSRTFEANVVVKLRAGGVARDTFTTAAEWSETWGEFRVSLGRWPRTSGTLWAGEYSPKDGAAVGVEVPVPVTPS